MTAEHMKIVKEMLDSKEMHPEEAEAVGALLDLAKRLATEFALDAWGDDPLLAEARNADLLPVREVKP